MHELHGMWRYNIYECNGWMKQKQETFEIFSQTAFQGISRVAKNTDEKSFESETPNMRFPRYLDIYEGEM